jgi:phage tail-like protein
VSSSPETVELLRAFNFRVKLFQSAGTVEGAAEPPTVAQAGRQLGDGGFQECTGLDIELDVQELVEGGRNNGVIRRVGRAKYQPIVLKRGMFSSTRGTLVDPQIWTWLQGIASGVRPVVRYDGIIEVLDAAGVGVSARWTFVRGLPAKVTGPALNAKTGDVAIEELHIAHEGLALEPT